MFAVRYALGMFVADLFKSRSRLEAENLFLRHQLNVAMRRAPPRPALRGSDRAFLFWMVRLWPSLIGTVQVAQPEAVLRWHLLGQFGKQVRGAAPEVATGRNIALEIAGNAWRSFTQAMLTRAERPASHSNFTNSIRDYPLFQA
jgi:hypothetical protein